MTREQAIEKIKKLQALKEGASKIQSEGEAKNAAAIIDKLQKQFGITMQEVYGYTSNEATTDNSSVKNEYTEEQRKKAMNTLHEKLYTHFHGYINYYVHEKDPNVRFKITVKEIGNYRDFVLDNENLVAKFINNGLTYPEYQAIVEEECQNAIDTLNNVCDEMEAELNAKKQKTVTFKVKGEKPSDDDKVTFKIGGKSVTIGFFTIIFLLFLLLKGGVKLYNNNQNKKRWKTESVENNPWTKQKKPQKTYQRYVPSDNSNKQAEVYM